MSLQDTPSCCWKVKLRPYDDMAVRGHPLHYVAFLDYSIVLLLLHHVGGGYAFQHRLLRNYIGALSNADLSTWPTVPSTESATAWQASILHTR